MIIVSLRDHIMIGKILINAITVDQYATLSFGLNTGSHSSVADYKGTLSSADCLQDITLVKWELYELNRLQRIFVATLSEIFSPSLLFELNAVFAEGPTAVRVGDDLHRIQPAVRRKLASRIIPADFNAVPVSVGASSTVIDRH